MSSQFIFEISKTTIICRISGMFSLPEVKHTYKHFRTLVTDMEQPFAIIMDMREFQGTTPEGFEEAERFNQWLASSQLVVKVNITTAGVMSKIVDQNIPTRKNYHFQEFREEQAAVEYTETVLERENSERAKPV